MRIRLLPSQRLSRMAVGATRYEIEAHGGTSRVRWEAECDFAAGDLLAGKIRTDKQSQAEEIIRRLLAAGPRPEREVRQACQAAGIGISNYKNARAILKVETRKSSLDGSWILYLAESNMAQPILPLEGVNSPDTQNINPFA